MTNWKNLQTIRYLQIFSLEMSYFVAFGLSFFDIVDRSIIQFNLNCRIYMVDICATR